MIPDSELTEMKDYAQSLCMMPHGGSVPGKMLLKAVREIQELRETIAVLRTPSVVQPERE